MKVNMTPNPLDVVTIHASQGDTEARQWEFELHNNGELIDTSNVTEQMFFKAYKGGTEQILPENTSTPTTSPFLGDIRYPQGLLTDQEFLYRQSPTEEDGLAKIQAIYGNTLKWNQLAEVTNSFTSITINGVTLSKVDNHLHIEGTATDTAVFGSTSVIFNNQILFVRGHKYFLSINSKNIGFPFGIEGYGFLYNEPSIVIVRPASASSDWRGRLQFRVDNGVTVNSDIYLQAFDLTAMGIADKTDADIFQWFADYFPLNYYSYNSGSLIPFMGNGIKTVGKNLLPNKTYKTGNNVYIGSDSDIYDIWLNEGTYTITRNVNESCGLFYKDINGSENISIMPSSTEAGVKSRTFTITESSYYRFWFYKGSGGVALENVVYFQLEFGSTATEYEPYTSHTTNLPVSTYFPTGMKSARSVYDELTPTKAITRIGAVDLGSLSWVLDNGAFRSTSGISNMVQPQASVIGNILCPLYRATSQSSIYATANNMCVSCLSYTNNILVRNDSYVSASDFKNAMQGQYLYYELATPTETSFTTASLVTENAEIPLSNNDGVLIGKCTEQLSENPGFIDAKIKLADADGECYSNKIQLHIERSPQ